jgi:hypothetical protein
MRTRLATVATSTLTALVAACSAAGPGTTAPPAGRGPRPARAADRPSLTSPATT